MANIFADYLELYDWHIYNTLLTYKDIFDKVKIDITQYESNFRWEDWECENLQKTLNKILLLKAKEEGVIPEHIDIDEYFYDLYRGIFIEKTCENYQDIIKNFKDWCGIIIND